MSMPAMIAACAIFILALIFVFRDPPFKTP